MCLLAQNRAVNSLHVESLEGGILAPPVIYSLRETNSVRSSQLLVGAGEAYRQVPFAKCFFLRFLLRRELQSTNSEQSERRGSNDAFVDYEVGREGRELPQHLVHQRVQLADFELQLPVLLLQMRLFCTLNRICGCSATASHSFEI